MGRINIEITKNNLEKAVIDCKADIRSDAELLELKEFILAAIQAYNDQINGY